MRYYLVGLLFPERGVMEAREVGPLRAPPINTGSLKSPSAGALPARDKAHPE